MRSSTAHLSRLAAVFIAATAAVAIDTAIAHASSGGGCANSPQGNIRSCISANGADLLPDLYVLNNSNCASVNVGVSDVTSNSLVWQKLGVLNGCALGHHGPWTLDSTNTNGKLIPGHVYVTIAVIVNSSQVNIGTAESPKETFEP